MEFLTAMLPYVNIGFFGALAARFTGANLSAIVLCCVLFLGATPIQAVGMLLTFLVFMQLTRHTQNNRLTWKSLRIFYGWRILIPVLFIALTLAMNPFYAIAAFVGFFLMEVMALLYHELPVDNKITWQQWIGKSVVGIICATVGLLILPLIPANYFYMAASVIITAACALAYYLGKHRRVLQKSWDFLVYGSYVFLGIYGLEFSDWLTDVQRPQKTALMRYLPLITIPVVFGTFIIANVMYGTVTLSGLIIALAATIATRLFGYYEVSGKGEFSIIALGMTLLAVICLALVQPVPVGVRDLLMMPMPNWTFWN